MIIKRIPAIVMIALFAATSIATAQEQPPPDIPLTSTEIRAILENAATKMERLYVDPEAGRHVAAALRGTANDQGIIGTTSSLALVPKINRVLSASHKDAHLAFGYSYEAQVEKADTLLTPAEEEALRAESEKSGHGVKRVERLPGNVGYIRLTGFRDPAWAAGTISSAMTLVQGTNALIIDLRDSQGGAPEMVAFLASYFFKEPVELSEVFLRPENLHKQSWTSQWMPGPRYTGPLYILTNKVTRSAAEGFAYSLQARKRATIVGAVTRGAAHVGRWEIVSPHFALYVPIGKVTETITRTDWEQVGVKPDVETAPDDALKKAQVLALQKVLSTTTDKDQRDAITEALNAVNKSQ